MSRAIRSPGSALKPFIYGLAMDEGLVHSLTVLRDEKRSFNGYMPANFDGSFYGELRLSAALQHS